MSQNLCRLFYNCFQNWKLFNFMSISCSVQVHIIEFLIKTSKKSVCCNHCVFQELLIRTLFCELFRKATPPSSGSEHMLHYNCLSTFTLQTFSIHLASDSITYVHRLLNSVSTIYLACLPCLNISWEAGTIIIRWGAVTSASLLRTRFDLLSR